MRPYLDNCCLQRPLDDQTQPRIRVETEAVFSILAAIQSGDHQMISSEALEYEIQRIPDSDRRAEVISFLTLASERLEISDATEAIALSFEHGGIRAMDAVHLALASNAKVDYFCTSFRPRARGNQISVGIQPIAELTHRAKNVLVNELGAIDAMRFLNQFRAGNGDYTKDRLDLFKTDTVKCLVAEIKALRKN